MFVSIYTKIPYLVISISWLKRELVIKWCVGRMVILHKVMQFKVLQKLTTKGLCNICKFIMTLVEPELALKLGDN